MEEKDAHATAVVRFNSAYAPAKNVRKLCHLAMRFCFVPGAQYAGYTQGGSDYEKLLKKFPKFEVNKLRSEVKRIVNEFKNARIAAKFRPGNDEASEKLADILNGKLQADADDSRATEARNNAFTEEVAGGFGSYRLSTTEEEDDKPDGPRRITFEPLYDSISSVWFDPDSKLQDKSDAGWAFVIYSLTPEKYKQNYDRDPATFNGVQWGGYTWANADTVKVAQYYERRLETVKLVAYFNPITHHRAVYQEDQIATVIDELERIGYQKIDEHTEKRYRIYCSVIDGSNTLEKAVRLPGSYIPVIPAYADRIVIDGVEYITGHVQPSMDSQRLYNFSVSAIAKTASQGGRQIPILNGGEVQGFEDEWGASLAEDKAYLQLGIPEDIKSETARAAYKPGVLGYTQMPQVPQAVSQLVDIANNDINQTSAAGQANQEVPDNVASETVSSFMTRTDMQSYGYMDNMAMAERHMAKVWLSMAREVYGSERKVRIKLPDGSDELTYLSVKVYDQDTGQLTAINDLSNGRYDVAIDVGPSFTTQRQATVAMLLELIKSTPENGPLSSYLPVLYAMLIQNVYAPGMEPLKEFNQKQMLLAGIVPPKTPEEAQELQASQQQQVQAAQSSPAAIMAKTEMIQAIAKTRTSMADEMNAKAKILDTVTDTWVKEAQAYNYLKTADAKSVDSAMNVLQQVTQNMAQDVAAQFSQEKEEYANY